MPDPRLTQLAAQFRAGRISRRIFLERLASVVGGAALAERYVVSSGWAQTAESGAAAQEAASLAVESAAVLIPSEGATLLAHLSRPQPGDGGMPFPGLLLVHEIAGLNDHIRAVAGRLAAEGYFVLAVDHLSRQGGAATFVTPDAAAAACGKVSNEDVLRDLEAATSYLVSHPLIQPDRIGVLGFGWGGERAFRYATVNPTLQAAVVFYGAPPPEDSLAALAVPVLGHYAENDFGVTSTVAPTRAAMQRLGRSYDAEIYPAADHGFFNDASPRYHETAAQQAWTRTLDFLKQHLAPEF